MESFICQNCGADVDAKFCSQCGQERQSRISLDKVGKDVYNGLFDFESPFLKTLYFLTVNPSKVYREYIDGARKRYFSPVRYSIWLMTLMVAIAALTDTVLIDFSQFENKEVSSNLEFKNLLINFQSMINSLLIPFYFVFAILTTGFIKLLFRREKYTFAELYLPTLLSISHFCLVYSLFILVGFFQNMWAQLILTILSTGYMCWGLTGIYSPLKTSNYFKSFIAIVLGTVSYMFAFSVLSFLLGYFSQI